MVIREGLETRILAERFLQPDQGIGFRKPWIPGLSLGLRYMPRRFPEKFNAIAFRIVEVQRERIAMGQRINRYATDRFERLMEALERLELGNPKRKMID